MAGNSEDTAEIIRQLTGKYKVATIVVGVVLVGALVVFGIASFF